MKPAALPGVPRLLRLAAAFFILGGLAYLALSPDRKLPAPPLLPPCGFKAATGLPCALCGGTRATRALLHGNIARAAYLNAATFPITAFAMILAGLLIWEAARGRALTDWQSTLTRHWKIPLLLVLALLIWWVSQVADALRGAKPDLIDLNNPIARSLSNLVR